MRHAFTTAGSLPNPLLFGLACALVLLTGMSNPVQAQSDDPAAFAQQRFSAGVEKYDANDFEGALEEFTASYELFASPNSQLYIARSLRELGRLADALGAFGRTVAEATDRARTDPRYAETRDAARTEGEQVRERVGTLELEVVEVEGLEVAVDGRVVPGEALRLPIVVEPGSHTVRATAEGHVSVERQVSVGAGVTRRVSLEVERDTQGRMGAGENGNSASPSGSGRGRSGDQGDPARHSGWTTAGWISAGVGAAALISFGTFALLADKRFTDLEEKCGEGPCSEELVSDVDEGQTFETIANVSIGVSLAALTFGAVSLLLGGLGGDDDTRVTLGPGGASVTHHF